VDTFWIALNCGQEVGGEPPDWGSSSDVAEAQLLGPFDPPTLHSPFLDDEIDGCHLQINDGEAVG